MGKIQDRRRLSEVSIRKRLQWIFIIIISAALVYKHAPSIYVIDSDMPSAYALCTPSNGVYTVDNFDSKVDCILVVGPTIVATGSEEDLHHVWVASNPGEDLKTFYTKPGSIVVPGLSDAHAHVLEWGFKQQLPLEDCRSVDEVIAKIKEYIYAHPDILSDSTRWIQGLGWDQTKWPTNKFPTADDFDRDPLLRGRPIALSRIDVHASWVSHSVLNQMGELPREVDGGVIMRDDNGKPTGVFVDNAMSLVPAPPWSEEQRLAYFETAMHDALSVGLTSVHDAASSPETIQFFRRVADEGKLPIRLYLMGNVESDTYWGSQIPRLVDYGRDRRLNVRGVKLFTDGALGSWGAALLAPYSDNPTTAGLMRSSADALRGLVEKFYEDGWQVNVHCIGDRANKVVLDIFEGIITSRSIDMDHWRPRIEHAQIMQISDLERIGRLGVIASVQPTHATSDMWYAEDRLGPERIKGAYAYQSLLRASRKNILPLGSDFPVEGINPLLGFYAAVSRLSVRGDSPNGTAGWYPAEALSRVQALRGMTRDAAYASFAEDERGVLRANFKADYVVLDRDIVSEEVSVSEILRAKVLATVVDGRVMFGKIS